MHATRCLFCRSRRCNYRIHTADGSFDEIACRKHGANLEAYADALLGAPGKPRMHTIGSGPKTRQKNGHAEAFAEFDREIARVKQSV